MTLHVGYAQVQITPSLEGSVYLAGFGRNRRAATVHDDLYARAIALQYGQTRLVVVALDLIGLGRHVCLEIQEHLNTQSPDVQLIITCTHTHHGPDTIGLWGPDETQSGVDPSYMDLLKEEIVAASMEALAMLQPAHLRSTSVQVTGVAKNARDPEILDEELTCLQFCRPESAAPLVTWLIFPCHPEVLWDQNPHITSDYFHSMRQEIEAGTDAPCVTMVGALGGMMTPDMGGHSFADAARMGGILAQAALDALESSEARQINFMALSKQVYDVPMQNPLFHMAISAGLLPDFLNDDGTFTTEANLLKLGDTWLLTVPGELLPKLGLIYKGEMNKHGGRNTAVIGLANDEIGYILPAEEFVYPEDPLDPGEHYEESMSVGIEAEPCLTAALETMLTDKRE